MGGVIGAVSGKFVFAAATFLLPATLDRHSVNAVIDPSFPTSSVSATYASKAHIGSADPQGRRRSAEVGLGAEEFGLTGLTASSGPLPEGVDLRLGMDVVAHHVFAVDMARRSLRLVLKGDYRSATRKLVAVPLTPAGGTRWNVAGHLGDTPLRLVLDLSSAATLSLQDDLYRSGMPRPNGNAMQLDLGGARLAIPSAQISSSAGSDGSTMGLAAFEGRKIVLDLPHNLIWVEASGAIAVP